MSGHRAVVAVKFKYSDRTYDYFCDLPVNIGDRVIVDTKRGEATVEVVEVKDHSEAASAAIKRVAKEISF